MKKLGLTAQRLLRRAWQQKSEAVQQFLEKDYPLIKAKAKRLGAIIYWGDESSVRSDYHAGTTWGAKGETPIVKTTGARFKVNMISDVSVKDILRFMVTESGLTAPLFVQFLQRMMKGQKSPVYLIVDGHPVHKAKMVKEFVAAQNGFLELYYLPGYSPELNPDELV